MAQKTWNIIDKVKKILWKKCPKNVKLSAKVLEFQVLEVYIGS